MRLPGPSPADPLIYLEGSKRTSPIVLQPGDVAFVTSEEGFRIPADIAGNIGIRFGFAGPGLLVHTGLLIHPGFGMDKDAGARLHFTIANLSPQQETIRPGEKIASVQFFEVGSATPAGPRSPAGLDDLEHRYLVEKAPLGLAFLSRINELTEQVETLQDDVARVDRDVKRVEKASNDLILFGVFIVAAAFLGVTATSLLALLEDNRRAAAVGDGLASLDLNAPEALLLAAVIGALLVVTAAGIRAFGAAATFALRESRKLARKCRPTAGKTRPAR